MKARRCCWVKSTIFFGEYRLPGSLPIPCGILLPMNLGNVSDKEFIELVLRAERETLTELLAQYAGQERRREIILAEIHKRQLDDLYTSSETLKSLTKWLIALTIVLGILALPPFIETLRHLFH